MKNKTIELKEGLIVEFDTLSWIESNWEFDHPACLLRPVFWPYEGGEDHEFIVEDRSIMAVVDGKIEGDNYDSGKWRGYKEKNLKQVFHDALNGKKFPLLHYTAKKTKVKFFKDKYGEWTFDYI